MSMRYIVQFLIPALILIALAYAFVRARRSAPKAGDSTDALSDGAVVLVVLIGAVLAVVLIVALYS